jgi:hypothetical protein
MIHIGPEPCHWGSGSIVVRGGGGSRKMAVALLGAHTHAKNRAQYQGYKHTSLNYRLGEFWEVRITLSRNALETVVL